MLVSMRKFAKTTYPQKQHSNGFLHITISVVCSRDEFGRFFTILESPYLEDETTGLSFSPDGKHMYIAYQENGILFDVTREDGRSFDAKSLDVKYHNSISSRRLNTQWVGMQGRANSADLSRSEIDPHEIFQIPIAQNIFQSSMHAESFVFRSHDFLVS